MDPRPSHQDLSLSAWPIRAVQLDLARQMETVDFILRFCDFIAENGYNALVLYLEGRVQTDTFPYRPRAHSYSLEEMDRVVRYAAERGLSVVPAVSVLGHAEQFFACPELAPIAEEREGAIRMAGGGLSTFCPALEETWTFLRGYFTDLATVFTSPELHVGCDEVWHLASCPLCRDLSQREGLGAVFTGALGRMHEITGALGKRMWIWDDMWEFFPEALETIPRDILQVHWDYDAAVDYNGGPAHFRNCWRGNWLERYERLGFPAVIAPWVWMGQNTESLTAYGRRHAIEGGLLTQWEASWRFLDESLPSVAMTGRLWSNPELTADEAWEQGLQAVLPGSDADLRRSARTLAGIAKRHPYTSLPPYMRGPLSESDGIERTCLQTGLALLRRARQGYTAEVAQPVLDDLDQVTRLDLLIWQAQEMLPVIFDPRRQPGEAAKLRREAEGLRADLEQLITEREPLHLTKRPGMHPSHGAGEILKRWRDFLQQAWDRLDHEPQAGDWLLRLRLYLSDPRGAATLKATVRCGEQEHVLLEGVYKQGDLDRLALFSVLVPFTSATPPEEVRIEVWGYGGQGVTYVDALNPEVTLVPQTAEAAGGIVSDPEHALMDDSRPVYLGSRDINAQIHDSDFAHERSVLVVKLG